MADYVISKKEDIVAIADAIRSKTKSELNMTIDNMVTTIGRLTYGVSAHVTTSPVDMGESTIFVCTIENMPSDLEIVDYQWYFADDGITWHRSSLVGDTITCMTNEERINRQYYCVVMLSDGSMVISNAAKFEFTNASEYAMAAMILLGEME